jgi:hypothetical protein
MKTPKPAKRIADDALAPQKPDPLAEDDAELAKLGALKVADDVVDNAEPPAAVIAKIPENRRAEASAALRNRWKRMRQYVSGASDELDW